MQTVQDIRKRAACNLRRRIFERGIFRRDRMRRVAAALARKHAAGMSPEHLRSLARRAPWLKDTWLKSPRGGASRQHSGDKTAGASTGRIAEELESFLRPKLRAVVDTFWEGRTSVELLAKSSSAELKGFFNGSRPGRRASTEGSLGEGLRDAPYKRYSNAHDRHHAPYA